MPTAIEFENVSKQYRLGLVSTRTLAADLNRWWTMNIRGKEDPYLKIGSVNDRSTAADSEYVWALRDIDFKVEQGDVVGIIGKNGAGKSTLLKLLSKVTGPTTGSIKARGRIGALLEVGTGFHSEMTGRENIYLNGAILGMNKQEIAAKLDEIVDFSGCERYIDTPVKRYSSGMMVRLGFAVAAHLDPEILVVDEVLAVGDAEFQKKAIGRMQDISKGEGRTVLFVSHNMASVKALCRTGILLENGTIKYTGSINDAIGEYIGGGGSSDNQYYEDIKNAPGNDTIRIKSVEILPADNSSNITIETGIIFRIKVWCFKENSMLDVSMNVKTLDDIVVFGTSGMFGGIGEKDSKKGIYTLEFQLSPYSINAGKYCAEIWFGENQRYLVFGGLEQRFEVENTASDQGYGYDASPGYLRPKQEWKVTYEERYD